MKQVLQNKRTGEIAVADVPTPALQRGRVLVRAAASLISAGTERATVSEAEKSLLDRAISQPELVKKVLNRIVAEGISSTVDSIRSKLASSTALGYSAAGIVIGVGEDVNEFREGDRVACAGVGYASHAEVLSVPKNLCVRLPDCVGFEDGAFGTLGAIALQAVRLTEPLLGETVVVIGLGLIGQLCVQLLKANGCRVFGIDIDPARIELAKELGADGGALSESNAAGQFLEWNRGRGADAVLIAAGTKSNQPIELAGELSRLKGRVVAVGAVGLEVPRQSFFQRELKLIVSRSYGPGRYDSEYEERGHDYPFAYVRWTEQRNIEAFLDLIASRRIDVARLTTHRFSVDESERAYKLITDESGESYLGVLLLYDTAREIERRLVNPGVAKSRGLDKPSRVTVGVIGAGDYARRFLLPNLKAQGVEFRSITTATGVTAKDIGEQFGFRQFVSDPADIFDDQEINLVVIATRHDSHAEFAARALDRGQNVFVEKPLALSDEELDRVLAAAAGSNGQLMVGFNRRFSLHARQAAEFFAGRSNPLSILYRVNAGRVPVGHWAHDAREGGGRIVGEVCHFVDLIHFITGAMAVRVYAEPVVARNESVIEEDSVFITMRLSDGSNASIAYLAEGDPSLQKERIEIYGENMTFVIEDFKAISRHQSGRVTRTRLRGQDKGQAEEMNAVCRMALNAGPSPVSLRDIEATTRATFRMRDSLRSSQPIAVELSIETLSN